MREEIILIKAIELEPITLEEGMFIYENVSTNELMLVANECRQKQAPGNKVGWIIDRNVNITNVCVSGCQFCNFHCKINEEVQYITTFAEYTAKRLTNCTLLAGDRCYCRVACTQNWELIFILTCFRN